ncbi:hypothetical protein [Variovorax sp.]|jgi:hypothetical protein|uniref:hypothetical protein n=1 Tax=Variovorax sp. TaxID=1871043 RepID=UPI0037DA2B26
MPMLSLTRIALLPLAVSLALSGCTAFPVYQPAANEPTVPLKVSGWGIITFKYCVIESDKSRQQLSIDDKTLTTSVPAGKPIMLNAYRASSGYQVVHYCNARLNFTPKAGNTYVLNSGMVGEGKCFVELVREDLSTDTGLVPEPSVEPGSC